MGAVNENSSKDEMGPSSGQKLGLRCFQLPLGAGSVRVLLVTRVLRVTVVQEWVLALRRASDCLGER